MLYIQTQITDNMESLFFIFFEIKEIEIYSLYLRRLNFDLIA